jgi:hypothetical protein
MPKPEKKAKDNRFIETDPTMFSITKYEDLDEEAKQKVDAMQAKYKAKHPELVSDPELDSDFEIDSEPEHRLPSDLK